MDNIIDDVISKLESAVLSKNWDVVIDAIRELYELSDSTDDENPFTDIGGVWAPNDDDTIPPMNGK